MGLLNDTGSILANPIVAEEPSTDYANGVGESNSPIVWLGNFIFNGLPHTVSRFKSPFSSLYWYDSVKDIKRPTKKIFNNLF